ncbi:MAG: DUF6056 family protein, partial [Alphaproteobacteria bacterium]
MTIQHKVIFGWGMATLLAIFSYIALVSYLTPLMVEDFLMKGNGALLPSWEGIWDRSKGWYGHSGGRIAYVFFQFAYFSFYRAPFEENFSQIIYALFNGVVFVSFLLALFFLAFARKPKFIHGQDIIKIILSFFLAMIVLADEGLTIFWLHGRLLYLLPTTILLWFLVFYRLQWMNKNFLFFTKQPIKQFWFLCFFLPLAFIAGRASHVGGLVVLICLLGGFIYKKFMVREKLPLWAWLGLLGFMIGYGILTLAPGNLVRLNRNSLALAYFDQPFLERYIGQFLEGCYIFMQETLFLPIIALFGLVYWYSKIIVSGKNIIDVFIKKIKKDTAFATAMVFFMLAMLFVAAQGGNPFNYAQTWFFGTVMFLLCCMVMVDKFFLAKTSFIFLRKKFWGRSCRQYLFMLISLCYIFYFVHIFFLTSGFHKEFRARVDSIMEQKNQGKDVIVLKKYSNQYLYSYSHIKGYRWLIWLTSYPSFWGWKTHLAQEQGGVYSEFIEKY